MWKIIKLDKILINQIAAWEVVERPVSVVKEIIENSIDAKADKIKVEIFDWWIKKIIVSDNWEWIAKEDLSLIWEKHSTSKIKNLNDLHNILTFWFRWEAVASISSVSDLEIQTKTNNSKNWYSINFIAWEKSKIKEISKNNWTTIIIENLFYNTPARLNYLKTARTEYNHIQNYLYEISIAYPNIWFEFFSDSKKIFNFKEKEDLKTRIYNIYWEDFSSNLLNINFEFVGIKIDWYISDPKISFQNRNRQLIFINKRPIKSIIISKAINDAYNRFIPHSSYPWYILNIQIDPTLVDVNVHPRKLEVRFENEQNIFKAVYNAVGEKLKSVSLIWEENISWKYYIPEIEKAEVKEKYYVWSGEKFKSYSPYKNLNSNPNQKNIEDSINFTKSILNDDTKINYQDNFQTFPRNIINEEKADLHTTKLWRIIWQTHNSYIIVETKDWIKFLDQHALAERIIYEKLVNKKQTINSQRLLISESIKLLPNELSIVEENLDTFNEMWFDIEIMPNMLVINSIPSFIEKSNIKDIFSGIIQDLWDSYWKKSKTLEEIKNKIYAYTACRSAIKFWNKLNLFEMNALLNDSLLDYSSTCPHWRPVVFEISLDELKKKYER